jgi:polyisoprenyl-teichoic acid--peptidoglycan teichoic acid transferase
MRTLAKLLCLAAGLLALAGLAHRALRARPFRAAPELDFSARPRSAWAQGRAELVVKPGSAAPLWLQTLTKGIPTPPLDQTTNLLLAGIDTRTELSDGRTDALLVLALDERQGHVGVVSIPRDLLVAIPGEEPNRINTVFRIGHRTSPARGVELLKEVVRHNLGLPIWRAVFVDQAAFEGLVDQLDGITVDVSCPIRDRFIDPRGPGGRLELNLEDGVQRLDGRTALMYARSRHGRGVFDRARRQQAILLGVRDRLAELGPSQLSRLLPLMVGMVSTDLSVGDLFRLAKHLHAVKRDQIHGLVLGGDETDQITLPDGRWVLVPRPAGIVSALEKLFEARAPGYRRPSKCPDKDAALRGPE